jgi:Flp pilus assembly protein CpaB
MTYRIRNIGIAVALALLALLLTTFYVSNYKRNVQQGESNVRVWVASRDIPAGTIGTDAVRQHLLQPQDVARRNVVPGAISDPTQVDKLVSSQTVFAGEQVTLRRFDAATEQGVRGQLSGTMRAIQVPGDPNQLLAGTVETGDHVDVIANIDAPEGKATKIVLRDINVLRAAGALSSGERAASVDTSVLLAVRDTQVQRLFFVLKNADWSLQLRPARNADDSRDVVETTNSVMNAGSRRTR